MANILKQPLDQHILDLERENKRFRAALVVCGAAWVSGPGPVMACEKELHEEFNRRMQIAFDALRPDQQTAK